MKRTEDLTLTICIILTTLAAGTLRAQDTPAFTGGPTTGSTTIGGSVSVGGRYSTLEQQTIGFLDARAGITIDGTWGIGLGFAGLYYDKTLSALVTDGTYHLTAGYSGIYVERIFRMGDDLQASVGILMGQGTISYQYDNEFRKEKRWTDEVIDQTTFAVFEPGVSLQYRLGGNFWLGVTASYRNTSPIRLFGASESILRNGSAGLTASWDVF